MIQKITRFPVLQEPQSNIQTSTFSPSGTAGSALTENTGFNSNFTGDLFTSRGRFGNGTEYWDITAIAMKSANFVSGVSGCCIYYDGSVEFNDGYFRGDISAATGAFTTGLAIGTSPNWFKVDANGDSWWGGATLATATTSITSAGLLTTTNAVVTGSIITAPGSTINGTYIESLSVDKLESGQFKGIDVELIQTPADPIDSYSETNRDDIVYMASDGATFVGQSFYNNLESVLDYCKFYLRKYNAPTGNAYAKVYAVYGGQNQGNSYPGTLLATSDAFDVSTLTTDFTLITFTFSGAEKVTLIAGNWYHVVIIYSGGGAANYIGVGLDTSSPTHGGVCGYGVDFAHYNLYTGYDVCFYVYKDVLDCAIRSGKHSFDNTDSGFILGIDASDSNKGKFYIGNTTEYLNWDGTHLLVSLAYSLDYTTGDRLVVAADTERSKTNDPNYTKVKEITIQRAGTLRITFDGKRQAVIADNWVRIYRNGVAVGTAQEITTTDYATFTEDITGWSVGDKVQLYYKTPNDPSGTTYVKNFRLYEGTLYAPTVDTN